MTIDDEVITELLAKVEQGAPLRAACQEEGVPDIVVLQKYLRQNPALMNKLRAAKIRAKHRIAEDPLTAQESRESRLRLIEEMKYAR